jgi:protein-tyrosine phosphatase
MDRVIRLEKVQNLRELGGLPAANEQRVAPGRLFRAGSLYEMTAVDRAALEAMGIRIIIDLRSSFEQQRQSYEWPAGRKVAAPLAEDGAVATIFARFQAGSLSERDIEDWWNLTGVYDIPTRHRDSLHTIFTTLLEAGADEGVLYHCTGGKDRTGIVSALVLDALGVTRQAILEDFLLTNAGARARAAEFIQWMKQATGHALSPEAAYWLAGVKEQWLEEFFRRLADRYGSTAGYLRDELQLGAEDLAALRGRYLEPAAG